MRIEDPSLTYHRLLYNICLSRPLRNGIQFDDLLLRFDYPVCQNPLPGLIGGRAGQPMTPR